MNNIKFIITDDSSMGLYNESVNDIYHSKTGAYTEALEKFILPSKIIEKNGTINILDICYGVGYNTKTALFNAKENSELKIDCLEYDKNLTILSPFIKDSINEIDLKLLILAELLNSGIKIDELKNIISDEINSEYFIEDICNFIQFLSKNGYTNNLEAKLNLNLHNIYYNYISVGMNNNLLPNKYKNSSIYYHFGDARKTIKTLNRVYDVIFLDAFSPQKDPTLWTINFLSEVKQKMKDDSIIVSYSKSTPFRSALLELNFFVGKTYINEVDMGTVASLNQKNIINHLTDYDLDLISTRSGITYKDENLTLSPMEILKQREIEQNTSKRISQTAFLKQKKLQTL